jgi:uncharacterized membrane protein
VIVWQYRNSVVQLSCIRVCSVVHQDHISQITVNYSKIFAIHSFWSLVAVLSIEAMMNVFAIGIQIIKHYVGIAAVTCRKHYYFKVTA